MSLPSLHSRWVEELLAAPLPTERKADCASCPMLGSVEAGHELVSFHATTKCCTYWPVLPNYLLGGILATGTEGRAAHAIRTSLNDDWIVPRGAGVPAHRRLQVARASARGFGTDPALRCPYYAPHADGFCGIWSHRNSTCASWFCKHDRGPVGLRFWTDFSVLFASVERLVSIWCALDLGIPPYSALRRPPQPVTPTSDETALSPDLVAEGGGEPVQWANWTGRREDFFRRCNDLASGLNWRDIEHLGGPELSGRAALVRARFVERDLDQVVTTPIVTPLKVVRVRKDSVSLLSYRATDPLTVSRDVFDALVDAAGGGEPLQARCDATTLKQLKDWGIVRESII